MTYRPLRRHCLAVMALVVSLVPVTTMVASTPRPASASVTPSPRTSPTTPAYTFHDLGLLDTVGYPLGISDTGEVALTHGVWAKGIYTPLSVPGNDATSSALLDISPNGVAVGVATIGGPCTDCFSFLWNQRTSSTVQFYPQYPETLNNLGAQCGGAHVASIDSAGEGGGTLTYVNAIQHAGCTAGDTTTVGLIAASKSSGATRVDTLTSIRNLQPNWALGLSGAGYTTLFDRVHDTTTVLSNLDLSASYREHELAADGGMIAGLNPSEAPQYRAPDGTITPLPTLPGDSFTTAVAINDHHEIVGYSSQHELLWPSPTSTPITIETNAVIPAADSLGDALAISNEGDIAGTFVGADNLTHVYVLSVATSLSASIALTNSDGTPFTGAGSKIGDTVVATVTLANTSPTMPVTALSVIPSIAVSPSAALVLVSGPTPAVPTSLAADASAQYVETFTIGSLGKATLSLTANGTQNALAASASASVVAHLGQPLLVSVSFTDSNSSAIPANTIKMVDTDTGEIAQTLGVVVTIKNVGTVQQDNLAFNGPLIASFHSSNQALPTVPVTVSSGPVPSDPLGDLAQGASVTRTYVIHVTNNGVFDLSSQVTSGDHGGVGTNVSTGVGTLTANPTAILFLKLHPVTDVTKLLTPGQPVLVSGTLVNRSQTQSIDLIPVEPTITGSDNAGGGILSDSSVSPLPDGVTLPLAGVIAPATIVNVEAEIGTAPIAGTRATITYEPRGYLIAADGTETELTPSEIRVASGTSPIQLHMDTHVPVDTASASALAGVFAKAAFIGVSQWYLNGFHAGLHILQHPVDSTVHFATGAVGVVTSAASTATEAAQMLGAMYVFMIYSESLTPDERQNFADQIVADYEASGINTAHQALQKAADPILLDFETAVQTGNYTKIAQMSGSGLATATTTVADTMLADIAFQKIALLAKTRTGAVAEAEMEKTITLADAIQQAGIKEGKAGAALANIKMGQNLLAFGGYALQETYGLTSRQINLLKAFCEQNGIIVALRSRSARAADLIKRGIAVGKNLVIKLKNVDAIDVAYLNYAKGDLNTVVWAKPITENELLWNMRHLAVDDPLRVLATKRWEQRVAEWANKDYQAKFLKWKWTKQIQLAFDGAGSSVAELDKTRTVYRRFAMEDRSVLQGRYYQKIQVGIRPGANAPLAFVTQDVDLVALLGGNGSILPAKLRAKAYEYLENILGIQHPDTIPWIKDGEVAFEAKTKLLVDHLTGGEALAVFGSNGGVTAGFFDPALTVFNRVTLGGYVYFLGAYNNPYARVATGSLGKLLP